MWNSTGIAVFNPEQTSFTRNPPLVFLPEIVSPPHLSPGTGSSSLDTSFSNPTILQHMPEEPSDSDEDGDKEDQEIVEVPVDPAPKRKRGRPKLNRRASEGGSSKNMLKKRVPHSEVERRYRQALNAEMERLRVNVPTLSQHSGTSFVGPPKPSKATVLAAAVNYIETLEAETKRLIEENGKLKCERIDYHGG